MIQKRFAGGLRPFPQGNPNKLAALHVRESKSAKPAKSFLFWRKEQGEKEEYRNEENDDRSTNSRPVAAETLASLDLLLFILIYGPIHDLLYYLTTRC